MSSQQRSDLLARLIAANTSYYDVESPCAFGGRTFPAFAEFHTQGEKYVLAKRAKLWEVNTHDYLFFLSENTFDAHDLSDAVEFMTTEAIKKVHPGPDHMSSALSLVVLADSIEDDAAKALRKIRFRKNYRFSLHGWSDLRIAAVDYSQQPKKRVICNSMGKPLAQMLESNLALQEENEKKGKRA